MSRGTTAAMLVVGLAAVVIGTGGARASTVGRTRRPIPVAARARGREARIALELRTSSRSEQTISSEPVLPLPSVPVASDRSDSLSGTLSGVAGALANPIDAGAGTLAGAGLGAIDSWVLTGAGAALTATATAISQTTAPRLQSTWFSSSYWHVAGLATLLTLPFLFAAAVQALLRSDLALLLRSAFCYLPLAMVGLSLAAPLTMLLLSATDELCAAVSPAGETGGAHFLSSAALAATGISSFDGSDFLAFVVGLFTVAAALALLLEMLIREAAVYIVVLMLPLAFAAMVWPARRIWAIRMLELLVSLILSKFAVVAVLALGGAAYGDGTSDPSRLLTAMALVLLSTFAPWAMLRLIPFTEIAAGAGGALRSEVPRLRSTAAGATELGGLAAEWLPSVISSMREHAHDAGQQVTRTPDERALTSGTAALRGASAREPAAGANAAHPEAEPGPGADAASGTGAEPSASTHAASGTGAEPGADASAPLRAGAEPGSGPSAEPGTPEPARRSETTTAEIGIESVDPGAAARTEGASPPSAAGSAAGDSLLGPGSAGQDPPGAESSGELAGGPPQGIEALLQAPNHSMELQLGSDGGWPPSIRAVQDATGSQVRDARGATAAVSTGDQPLVSGEHAPHRKGAEHHDPLPQPQPDESGLL